MVQSFWLLAIFFLILIFFEKFETFEIFINSVILDVLHVAENFKIHSKMDNNPDTKLGSKAQIRKLGRYIACNNKISNSKINPTTKFDVCGKIYCCKALCFLKPLYGDFM